MDDQVYILGGQRSALASSTISTTSLEQLSTLDMTLTPTSILFNITTSSSSGGGGSGLYGNTSNIPLTRTGHAANSYGKRLLVFGGAKYDTRVQKGSGGLVYLNDVVYAVTNSTSGVLTWKLLVDATGEG
ncbi:MAG: hypothetical protein WDW36_009368 [Sanguina aurantia]